jgi:hypothetical protein
VQRAVDQGVLNWVLEAELLSFFDSLDRQRLAAMLQERVAEGSPRRPIGQCPHAGVLCVKLSTKPENGTAQESVQSPSLGTISLH